jgi:hypothetical protein
VYAVYVDWVGRFANVWCSIHSYTWDCLDCLVQRTTLAPVNDKVSRIGVEFDYSGRLFEFHSIYFLFVWFHYTKRTQKFPTFISLVLTIYWNYYWPQSTTKNSTSALIQWPQRGFHELASMSLLAIRPGSLQCPRNVAPSASISFPEIGKYKRDEGEVWWAGGVTVVFVKSKAAVQGVTCFLTCRHGAGPKNCCATWLQVCAGLGPSAASEHHNRIFHSRHVLMGQTP